MLTEAEWISAWHARLQEGREAFERTRSLGWVVESAEAFSEALRHAAESSGAYVFRDAPRRSKLERRIYRRNSW